MPDHKDIADAERHEPKGASTALAGQALVSNGDGTTSFATLDTLQEFNQAIISTNTTTAIAATADPDFATNADYIKLTAGWTQDASSGTDIIFNTDKMEIYQDGSYQVDLTLSAQSDTANSHCAFKLSIDDAVTGLADLKVHQDFRNANIVETMHASRIVPLLNGAVLSLWAVSDTSINFTITDAVVSIRRLK